MKKKIFIHADDFGRSKNISNNILKCINSKNINSTSVMVGFDERYFNIIKKKKLKLSFTLTLQRVMKIF